MGDFRNGYNAVTNRTETPYFTYHIFEPPYGLMMGFTNGRHRTVNLAALGAPWIPMEVSTNTAEALQEFKERFGYKPLLEAVAMPRKIVSAGTEAFPTV